MPINPNDRRWLKDWGLKLGASAYLLFVFAFMASHAAPGSVPSLIDAMTRAIVPALISTFALLGIMLYLRKR